MTTETLMLLAGYSLAIMTASLLGGWLPSLVRMTHTRTQVIMSFVAGLMLGAHAHAVAYGEARGRGFGAPVVGVVTDRQ